MSVHSPCPNASIIQRFHCNKCTHISSIVHDGECWTTIFGLLVVWGRLEITVKLGCKEKRSIIEHFGV